MQCFAPVDPLLTRRPSLPGPEHLTTIFQHWRYGPLPHPGRNRGCTSLTHDGRDLSSCTRLQDQDRITYSTLMARRSQTSRISSIYVIFSLSQPRYLRMTTYNLSQPGQETDQTHVKDLVVTSFGPTVTFSHGNKEFSWPA
jgi:hypothetical protein